MNFRRKRARPRKSFSSGLDFYALFYFFHNRIRELILNHLKNPKTPPKKSSQNIDSVNNRSSEISKDEGRGMKMTDMTPPVFEAPSFGLSGGGAE